MVFRENKNHSLNISSGFENNRSTAHELIEIIESIKKSCDNDFYSCGVFIYQNHKIFLSKLECYEIRRKAKNWFSSFIHNRQQCTSIDGKNSELNKLFHGVPQSSALGPFLFIIFIKDLHYAAK